MGFYLAHHAGQTRTTWTDHWHDLQDIGWGLVPFYLPFSDSRINDMATADGTAHGQEAVALARAARLESGVAIYLDIESPVLGAANNAGFTRYINNWFAAVRAGGYTPGAYCSRLDAPRILAAAFRATIHAGRRIGLEGEREFDRRVVELGDRGKGHDQGRGHAPERQPDGKAVVLDLEVPEAVLDDDRHVVGEAFRQMPAGSKRPASRS